MVPFCDGPSPYGQVVVSGQGPRPARIVGMVDNRLSLVSKSDEIPGLKGRRMGQEHQSLELRGNRFGFEAGISHGPQLITIMYMDM